MRIKILNFAVAILLVLHAQSTDNRGLYCYDYCAILHRLHYNFMTIYFTLNLCIFSELSLLFEG